MPQSVSIIIFKPQPQRYSVILKQIRATKMDPRYYEVIFCGFKETGFLSIVLNKEAPLVRAFYDSVLNYAQRLNAAILEAHCEFILVWPGICLRKDQFEAIPKDVVSADYYLMLWLRFANKEVDFKSVNFGRAQYHCNLKDTLRFVYRIDDASWGVRFWYLGWLLKAIYRSIFRRVT